MISWIAFFIYLVINALLWIFANHSIYKLVRYSNAQNGKNAGNVSKKEPEIKPTSPPHPQSNQRQGFWLVLTSCVIPLNTFLLGIFHLGTSRVIRIAPTGYEAWIGPQVIIIFVFGAICFLACVPGCILGIVLGLKGFQKSKSKSTPRIHTSAVIGVVCNCLTLLLFAALLNSAISGFWGFGSDPNTSSAASNENSITISLWTNKRHANKFIQPYLEKGYVVVREGTIDQPVSSPTIFWSQGVRINSDVTTDILILAQSATIDANVKGNVEFCGQVLLVGRNAMIEGDIHCHKAQSVSIQGQHAGLLTGETGGLPHR